MKCDKCSFINAPDAQFCNSCGTALIISCIRCGTVNPPQSRFCKRCGAELPGIKQEDIQAPVSPDPAALMTRVCAACGAMNEAAAAYCYRCGVGLPEQALSSLQAAGNPAGFRVRLAAYFIDALAVTIFTSLVLMLFSDIPAKELWDLRNMFSDSDVSFRANLINELIYLAYFTLAIGKWGQTLGKAMMGLKIVRRDGSKLTYMRSFARTISYNLSFIILGIGFLMIAFSTRKRGLHDRICDTSVLKIAR